MRITMIGTGYVGLVSGTCFAEFGMNVTCVDIDESKIERLKNAEIPIYEPGLEDLVKKQVDAGRLHFTTDLEEAVPNADVVFIAVGTPRRPMDGQADLSYVFAAAKQIAELMDGYTVVVTKSTVPVGTSRKVEEVIRETRPDGDFDVCSNPEFLREGAAISDFMRPDRVVIGCESKRAEDSMRAIYRPLYINETPVVFTGRETAEIIKYAANAFLATKITFINQIADLCEKAGGDVQSVAKALGMDGRISAKFLHAGPGYGGSCFPKDTIALAQTGQQFKAPQTLVESVVEANYQRQRQVAEKIIAAFGDEAKGKKVGILGIAFKPETDDVRDAPSLTVVPMLQEAGIQVAAYDPQAREQAEKHLRNVDWKTNAYDVAKDADAVVILTEWNEFRALDLKKLRSLMAGKTLFDFRNIYKLNQMETYDFQYISVGRPVVNGGTNVEKLRKVS